MNTKLTIAGTDYDAAARVTNNLVLDGWGWDLDADSSIEFREEGTGLPAPTFHAGQLVSVSEDSSGSYITRVAGEITNVAPSFTPEDGWSFGYRVRGLKYLMNRLFITAIDGTGTIAFNLSPIDDDYVASFAGQTVGQILTYLLTQHSTALTAIGVTTDATTTSQLAALTLVPPEPVYCSGRLGNAFDGVLQRWARNVAFYITGDGKARFADTTAFADLTLTEGTDPIEPIRFSRDISDVATRVQVRGAGRIFPGYVSLGKSTLTAAWTSAQQTAWKWSDFAQPGDAYDHGTIAAGGILGPTSVRVTSSDPTATWSINFWNGREAWIHLHNSLGTALTYTEARPVTACTALTAGGTSDITLGFDLENAGSSAYDTYELIGTYAPLGSGGNDRNNVYRLFDITDPGGWIAAHLAKRFPVPVPFVGYTGDAVAQTSYPEALIVKSGVTIPATFKVMPATGQLLFDEPVVKALNGQSTLSTGGAGVATPDDIYVLVAYSRGALTATYPADIAGVPQYAGKAKTGVEGLERTAYVDIDSWIYAGNQATFDAYAQMLHASMCDTICTGNVQYRGACTAAFAPGSRLSIAGTGYTTGDEAAGVPIRSFSLRFNASGVPQLYTSTLGCSSRRNPATGDRYYVHPTQRDQVGFKLNLGDGFDATLPQFQLSAGNLPSLAAGQAGAASVSDPTAVSPGDLGAIAGDLGSVLSASDNLTIDTGNIS